MRKSKRKADLLAKSNSPSMEAPIARDNPKIKVLQDLFLKSIKDFEATGNASGFDRLCSSLLKIMERAATEDLFCWFTVLARVGNSVPYHRLGGVLHALLSFRWYSPTSRHGEVLGVYSDAVVQAVTGSQNIIGHVYTALTRQIRCKRSAVGECEVTTTHDTIMLLHSCLRRLLTVVPASGPALLEALEKSYPTKFDAHMDRMVYLEATLLVTTYCEEASRGVLDLVVRNLLVLDVDIEMAMNDMGGEELTFSFEEGDEDVAKRKNYREQQRERADHMDALLEKVFDFVDNQHLHVVQAVNITSMKDFPPECAKQADFFRTLLHVFDSRILTTPKAQFVQFVVFYACTKSSHVYAPLFLSHLMAVFKNYSLDQAIRAAAATYIGSFVSRFSRLHAEATTAAITVLSEWAREYLERLPAGATVVPDLTAHNLFYVVCNCVFYMVCFRPQCVPSGFKFLMRQVIDGPLNPLLFTVPSIREELCSVAALHNVLDALPMRAKIRDNKRMLAAIKQGDFEFSFPFDPYLLAKGDMRLTAFYYHWQDGEEDVPPIRSTGESQSDGESEIEDDMAQAMSLGTPITGSFADMFHPGSDHGFNSFGSNVSSSANSPQFMV